MNKLQELYQERATFTKYDSEVPAALAVQIAEAEKEVLRMELLPIIEDSAMKTLPPYGIDGKVLIAMEYDNRSLTRIAIASDVAKINDFDVVKVVSDDDDDYDDDDDSPDYHRSKSIGFTVFFADGKVIDERTAKKTMIEAFKYMGLERASKYEGNVKGYPIIGREKREYNGKGYLQKYVDGWWIYTCLNNNQKVEHIKNIAKMLSIALEVKWKEDKQDDTDKPAKQKGKRAMYSLNGDVAFCKNRSVLNTVRQFLEQMSCATFKDVCDFFPRELQGSYGVVRSLDEIERRKRQNRTEDDRWFLEPEEILTAADGVRFAVSNEWGDNFASFQKHVTERLGWTLEEVE